MIGVDAVVAVVINKLADSLIQGAQVIVEVKDDMKWLEAEFRHMQAFLLKAEKVKELIVDIEKVARDTLKILKLDQKARTPSITDHIANYICCYKNCKKYDIGSQIAGIKKRVQDISRRRETYGIPNMGNEEGLALDDKKTVSQKVGSISGWNNTANSSTIAESKDEDNSNAKKSVSQTSGDITGSYNNVNTSSRVNYFSRVNYYISHYSPTKKHYSPTKKH